MSTTTRSTALGCPQVWPRGEGQRQAAVSPVHPRVVSEGVGIPLCSSGPFSSNFHLAAASGL